MKRICKWLKSNGIEFVYMESGTDKFIVIYLEKNCIWINGFGESMKYDKKITIHYGAYKTYGAVETTGYSLHRTLIMCKKYDTVIETLERRLKHGIQD